MVLLCRLQLFKAQNKLSVFFCDVVHVLAAFVDGAQRKVMLLYLVTLLPTTYLIDRVLELLPCCCLASGNSYIEPSLSLSNSLGLSATHQHMVPP